MSIWQEPGTTTKRITAANILPSGVGTGNFKERVIEEGDVLELVVYWPKPLVDVHFMHRKWLGQDYSFNSNPRNFGWKTSIQHFSGLSLLLDNYLMIYTLRYLQLLEFDCHLQFNHISYQSRTLDTVLTGK